MRFSGFSRFLPSPAMAVALAALVVAMGGVAVASIPGPGGVAKVCYSQRDGSMRVIDSSASCAAGENELDLASPQAIDLLRPYVEFAPGPGGRPHIIASGGVASVTRLSSGKYCVKPTVPFARVTGLATAEYTGSRQPALAYVVPGSPACPPHTLEVRTGKLVNGVFQLADEHAVIDPIG